MADHSALAVSALSVAVSAMDGQSLLAVRALGVAVNERFVLKQLLERSRRECAALRRLAFVDPARDVTWKQIHTWSVADHRQLERGAAEALRLLQQGQSASAEAALREAMFSDSESSSEE